MEALQVLEHKHPLKLVDLKLQLQNEEEEEDGDGDADVDEDDDGDDLITKEGFRGACDRCGEEINVYHRHYYKCMADSSCDFSLHKFCGELPSRLESAFHPHPLTMFMLRYNWSCVDIRKRIIHHPCHPHLLICAITKPVLCDCSACGRRHEGMFYQCSTTCTNFTIHKKIKKLNMIPDAEYVVMIFELWRIFGFTNVMNACTIPMWIAQHQEESHSCPSSCVLAEPAKTIKLLNILIFFISHSLMKHTAYQNTCFSNKLIIIIRCATENDDEIQTQGVCNNFALHEWCTRLPPIIENHPGHPQHTLHLIYLNIPGCMFDVFKCNVCYLHCNGFAYGCVQCKYYVDVTCGLLPKEITHKAHMNHLLSIVNLEDRDDHTSCYMCRRHHTPCQLSFRCGTCDIYIHPECALLLAERVRHKYDEHPMQLSYLPIENHKSEYFCEICEEDLNPHQSFYHCKDCVQSIHTACAPLILQSETHTYIKYWRSAYEFVNIKFGGILNTNRRQQGPLTFAQGLMSDGECSKCGWGVQYDMVFKRFDYKFAIHYVCYK
ncbi:unnamed protein product [Lactuca virosa]|uniref:DC1 domain-containing protein n=1 Tax=Lactuca virosa TaxID=75947 RepID=A0AAU9PM77_9ASTR|nr:unnamed protein product [Lactuca virosa]